MSPEDRYFEDPEGPEHNQDYNNLEEFEAMMRRWGVELPDEAQKPEPSPLEVLLTQWCKDKYKRPSDAVRALQEGRNHREAAAALFGYCYGFLTPFDNSLEDLLESERLCLERLEDLNIDYVIKKFNERFYQERVDTFSDLTGFRDKFSTDQILYPESPESHSMKSYVEVMLGATRAILSLSGTKQYDPDIDELLNNAYQIIRDRRVKEAEDFSEERFKDDGQRILGDVLGFVACLACAVVCNSLAHFESELRQDYARDYVTAFRAYVKGAAFISKTGYCIDYFSLPFAEEGYNEFGHTTSELEKVLDTWEQIKKHPGKVQNWPELHSDLAELYNVICEGEWEADSVYIPNDVPAFVYFPDQLGFCRGIMSQEELRLVMEKQREQEKQEKHAERMQVDFFGELWEYLEEDTRKRIISAEGEWYDGPKRGSCVQSAIEHYSNALETELHAMIFRHKKVQGCVDRILRRQRKDEKYKKLMGLHSLAAESLYLSDMSKLLTYVEENKKEIRRPDVEPIHETIYSLPIPEDGKRFLTAQEFTRFISEVYHVRNLQVHHLDDPNLLHNIRRLRKQLLGIGCDGYLMKLAEIKKQLPCVE